LQPFHFHCPFCQGHATVADRDVTTVGKHIDQGNIHGALYFHLMAITCPNPGCRELALTLDANYFDDENNEIGNELWSWKLRPDSVAKPMPAYVPQPIVSDYEEACKIRDLSPKASATLSRRCMQGIIRDYWAVSKARLVDEIAAIEDKVDPDVWMAIDAVRKIGNIGAHMEKDINVIVDVDPQEAQLLIELVELFIKEWYVARHSRQQRLDRITQMAAEKKEKKSA
jgi:hypothetical protein